MASRSPGLFQHYRWNESGLLILPFLIFLLAMTQLLLANTDIRSSLNVKSLASVDGLIPVFGLVGGWFVINVIMSIFFRKADQVLLPLVTFLSDTNFAPVVQSDLTPFAWCIRVELVSQCATCYTALRIDDI